jgi:ribonuclease J
VAPPKWAAIVWRSITAASASFSIADGADPSLCGVVISHPHVDHYGLLSKVARSTPIFIGAAAARILSAAAFFSPYGLDLPPAGFLVHRRPFEVGPFTITPYLNDHSAFDAYSLLVEAGGKRLFYTGDIRGHGRKAHLFEELLRTPPENVDALLMEGTHIRANGSAAVRGPTERDVEEACIDTFRKTKGIILAVFSPQNIDRLVTFYRSCIRSGRELVIDLYTAAVARATGFDTIPQADWNGVRVYLPKAQKAKVVRGRAFHRTRAVRASRIYPDEIAARRSELAMLFRPSMVREVETGGCLRGATAVWSMWAGYLRNPGGQRLTTWLQRHGIPLRVHHSSGHAHLSDLKRLVNAVAPERVVPIHSWAGTSYSRFFPAVDVRSDGSWWRI